MTIDELKKRDVINVRDATNFGSPRDISIDICTGKVTSIIVSPCGVRFSFSHEGEIAIPWCAVVRIGDGAILVDIESPTKRCEPCEGGKRHRFPFF